MGFFGHVHYKQKKTHPHPTPPIGADELHWAEPEQIQNLQESALLGRED